MQQANRPTCIAGDCVAVHQLLLAERDQLARLDLVDALHSTSGGERLQAQANGYVADTQLLQTQTACRDLAGLDLVDALHSASGGERLQ